MARSKIFKLHAVKADWLSCSGEQDRSNPNGIPFDSRLARGPAHIHTSKMEAWTMVHLLLQIPECI